MAIDEKLYQSIAYIADDRIRKTPHNITIEAYMREKISDKEYKVFYQGNTFSAFSMTPLSAVTNHKVWVVVPNGDMSAKKIIIYYE